MTKRLSKEDTQAAQEHMKEQSPWSASGSTEPKHSAISFHSHQSDLNTGSARDGRVKSGPSDMSGRV